MAAYYATWYPTLWLPSLPPSNITSLPTPLDQHMMYVQRTSKRLARYTFHQMAKYAQKLESKQSILNRVVDIGTELFAISATCSYAACLKKNAQDNALDLADSFCVQAAKRVETIFNDASSNNDKADLKIAKEILSKEFEWMENEIIK